jgi:hypothetical protein
MSFTEAEAGFVEQRFEFLDIVRTRYPTYPLTIHEILEQTTRPVQSTLVDRLNGLTTAEAEEIAELMGNGLGVVHIVPRTFEFPERGQEHPLLAFAERLRQITPIGSPIEHPMEAHPDALARFGQRDGTLKIYDLPIESGSDRYREQAETNEMFDGHNDGLGFAGLIKTVMFTLDSPPLVGGYTFFQNLVSIAPAIAAEDDEAFKALFLPDAITAIRPRGKGAIKVVAPVFFIGRDGIPQTFFRISTGEYQIQWKHHDGLNRARSLLERLARPFAPRSEFVHLVRPGETVVIDNQHVIHGRTPFVNPIEGPGRVLARKWFVPNESDSEYRHVPVVDVDRRWSRYFPEQFSANRLTGEWHYDQELDENVPAEQT